MYEAGIACMALRARGRRAQWCLRTGHHARHIEGRSAMHATLDGDYHASY